MRSLLCFALFYFSLTVLADSAKQTSELLFPLEENHVQILPQRFEYHLIDKDHIKIGDISMNANEIDFQLLKVDKQKSQYKLRFRWPAGFLQNGEIAIKDNVGKAIFLKPFDKKQIKILSAQSQKSSRGALAIYETSEDSGLVVKEIQKYPFFKFCVHREEPMTKIYLCSKDLYLKKSTEGLTILSRDSLRPQSFVEINGQPVGDQGAIFLNSPTESLSMRTLLLSGATLELDTRMKSIDFNDVLLAPNGKEIIVRAKGAEPVDPKLVKRRNALEWETRLETERPYIYLKGEGDLPLRQEFLIRGPIRKENIKVQITSAAPEQVYGSSLTLTLKASPLLTLAPADKKSSLKKLSADTYEWTLQDLERNKKNRRLLTVNQEANQFAAAYDVDRTSSLDANLRLMLPLWLQVNGLWIPNQKWGVDFQYENQLSKSSTDPDLQLFLLGAQFRFPGGVYGQDPSYFVEAYYQQLQNSVKNLSLMGMALGGELKNPDAISSWAQWTHAKIYLPLIGSDSDLKLKFSYDLEISLQRRTEEKFYYEAGLKYQNYAFQSDSAELKSSKAFVFAGIGAQF